MTDWLIGLLPSAGLPLLGAILFASCLGLPLPGSMALLVAGGFVATGDLSATVTAATALAAAIAGDQAGFGIGRLVGTRLPDRWRPRLAEAARHARRWGGPGVFFSRWLVAPLGPWVNLAGGMGALRWRSFTAWGAAGEIVWVAGYGALGYAFAGSLSELAAFAGQFSGFLAAGAVTAIAGALLWRAAHRGDANRDGGRSGAAAP